MAFDSGVLKGGSSLEILAPGVWAGESDLFLPGGIHFRSRMTALEVGRGALALISPNPIDDALAAELAVHGEVTHLVSPSSFHHLFLKPARERYPAARLLAAPSLAVKCPDLSVDESFGDSGSSSLGEEVAHVFIEGAPSAGEVCFFHRSSRTLIIADLVFNIHEYEGIRTGFVLRAVGAHKKLAVSRIWRRLVRDRAKVRGSLERVLEWDFDRVVVGHGRVLTNDARAELERALAPLLTR
ncbi:MAG TPA: hypothetical protein VIM73_14945 [Polyangiaceae bacterium]